MANKYLDGAGLDHTWDKIKAYLGNNYAAKSHTHTIAQITNLQTTLNGKANSSHTHTMAQITDLSSELQNVLHVLAHTSSIKTTTNYTLPVIDVYSMKSVSITNTNSNNAKDLYLPNGGNYIALVQRGSTFNMHVQSGGSKVETLYIDIITTCVYIRVA